MTDRSGDFPFLARFRNGDYLQAVGDRGGVRTFTSDPHEAMRNSGLQIVNWRKLGMDIEPVRYATAINEAAK